MHDYLIVELHVINQNEYHIISFFNDRKKNHAPKQMFKYIRLEGKNLKILNRGFGISNL